MRFTKKATVCLFAISIMTSAVVYPALNVKADTYTVSSESSNHSTTNNMPTDSIHGITQYEQNFIEKYKAELKEKKKEIKSTKKSINKYKQNMNKVQNFTDQLLSSVSMSKDEITE